MILDQDDGKNKVKRISEPTNGGKEFIENGTPFVMQFTVLGTSPILFHAWNCESVDEKGRSQKGSKSKKTDDINSYVYRDESGVVCIPGEYFRQSIIHAAKYRQDPRSPRKSAMDLYKAGVVSLTELASLGTKKWDYEDKRRVVVQRSGINRVRPAFKIGWTVKFNMMVLLPEYISQNDLVDCLAQSGKLIGIGDFRPTYGRFTIKHFEFVK